MREGLGEEAAGGGDGAPFGDHRDLAVGKLLPGLRVDDRAGPEAVLGIARGLKIEDRALLADAIEADPGVKAFTGAALTGRGESHLRRNPMRNVRSFNERDCARQKLLR